MNHFEVGGGGEEEEDDERWLVSSLLRMYRTTNQMVASDSTARMSSDQGLFSSLEQISKNSVVAAYRLIFSFPLRIFLVTMF